MDSVLQDQLDRNYRYQRYVYDATRAYYLLGRDELISGIAPAAGATVLEVGCGTARNLVKAARQYPNAALYGIDLSVVMLETARQTLVRSDLASRVRLAHADATSFDSSMLFGIQKFDRIFFSYALSMIPPWRAAIEHAVRHLAPGGSLHIVDFGQGEGLPPLANTALRAWLSRFHVTPRDALHEALSDFAGRVNAELKFKARHRGYSSHAVLTLPKT